MTKRWTDGKRMALLSILAVATTGTACAQTSFGKVEHHRGHGRHHDVAERHRARSRCATPPPPFCHAHRYSRWSRGSCGHYERRWVPPVYQTLHRPCGTPYTVLVRPGYYESVWVSSSPCHIARCRPPRGYFRFGTGGIRLHGHFRF